MAEERKTTEFDSYSSNKIKTLDDLFKYESQLLNKLTKLRKQLDDKTLAYKKDLIQKEIDDLLNGYKKVTLKIRKEAQKTVEEQAAKRRLNYQLEFEEYKALLDKQLAEKEKTDKKGAAKLKKTNEKRLADLQKAQLRQETAKETRDRNRNKREKREAREELLEASKLQWGGAGGWGNWKDQMAASMEKVGENFGKSIGKAFADISNKINSAMDTYAKYQSSIDARIQGSGKTFTQLQGKLKGAVGASPYLKTETMLNNLQSLVETGIVTNIEQRAFLQTIKDKVAQTFDAANGSLLRIVRLQQNDSTAARMGMEAYLTRFLNTMVENTEYLNQTFDSVQEALLEASSIMNTAASTEFEYVVQKWLGSLVGRGLSDSTANSIAGALGMLASGNVSGLSGSAVNNLLVMAASRAGLDYGDLLSQGLSATTANSLMKALVKYMNEINNSGTNVVRSQYAQTFGLNISDLMAASGLMGNLDAVAGNFMSYSGMYDELSYQLGQVSSRTHISEKLNNLFDNAQFSLASNIASSAALSALWKVTDMIQGVTGGIAIPMISVMGTAIDLETTVENLMKMGLIGIGSLGMIGDVVGGLARSGGNFSAVMKTLGINAKSANFGGRTTGRGLASRSSGLTSSITADIASNSSGEDIQDQTLNATMDEQKQKQAEAAAEQDDPMGDLRMYFLDVFDPKFNNLLAMVASSGGYRSVATPFGMDNSITIADRTLVRATYAVGAGDGTTLISTISDNVLKIFNLLVSGIDVNVNNFPSGGFNVGSSTLG